MKRVFQSAILLVLSMFLLTTGVSASEFCPEQKIACIDEVELPTFGKQPLDIFGLGLPEFPEVEIEVLNYTAEELDLLSRLITAEAGSSWLPDEVQLYVGSVVLNRMASDWYPDTLEGVIYQSGQYSPTWTGAIYNTPDQRTIENTKYLLQNGSILPENVVYQANFIQGSGIYCQYYDPVLGTTSYFCYRN